MTGYDVRQREVYADGRALSPHAERVWTDAFTRHLPAGSTIVDVACGTGRFARPVAEALGGRAIGVDASIRMLAAGAHHPRVSRVAGRAESLPLTGACADAALLSCVVHHLPDRDGAARELERVLRPGAVVCVRQPFAGRLDGSFHLPFFPTALAIAERTFPSVEDVCGTFGRAGFEFVTLETIGQETDATPIAYADRIAKRAISLLERISDEEFERGIDALRSSALEAEPIPVVEWVDLLVLHRS